MQLLPEDKLIWSPIVANSRMNRERNSSGMNSYEKEFKFRPEVFLESAIEKWGHSSWLDLCCGQGNALLQTAKYFYDTGLQDKIRLKGIDLLDSFQVVDKKIACLDFETKSVVDWQPDQKYDLITCVHGLHYLGDKLKAIETAVKALNKQGIFIANLDLDNIVIEGVDSKQFLKKIFKGKELEYSGRTRIIKRIGNDNIRFGLKYIGANDKAGPNYTGQEAVTSYYAIQ